jgi:uncharacterized membrane protein YfhO
MINFDSQYRQNLILSSLRNESAICNTLVSQQQKEMREKEAKENRACQQLKNNITKSQKEKEHFCKNQYLCPHYSANQPYKPCYCENFENK